MTRENKTNKTNETIFWNVDTQYDFMRDGKDAYGDEDGSYIGKLPVPGAREIEGALGELTALARKKGLTVVNTADWHARDSKELSKNPDFVTTFPEHCMIGTKGAEFVLATRPEEAYIIDWRMEKFNPAHLEGYRHIVLYKDHFDVFQGNPHTSRVVDLLSPKRAIVYGVAENVCVNYAVRGLLERRVEVYVVEDAIKGLPGIPSPKEDWKKLGARLITTKEVSGLL